MGAVNVVEKEINEEEYIGFDALYESMYKCRLNVGWKDSVASYCLNGIENTLRLERSQKDGTYTAMPQKIIQITHPKPRTATSIAFRDRVYQRSLNDNVVYPIMSKSYIKHNAACQKGKGTEFARKELDRFMREAFRKHGLDIYVLHIDVKGYYPNMRHWVAEECFRKHLPLEIYRRVVEILRNQYEGEIGYNPGSQIVQIAGISVLSPLDHYIKEKLRIRWYLRYMDDLILMHGDCEYLEDCEKDIAAFLEKMEFEIHPKKTGVYPISKGIKALGFTHKLTETGKVIHLIDPANVKAARKRLYRLVKLAKRGELTKEKVDFCYESWKAHARIGNTFRLLQRMDQYYASLWKGDTDETF